MAVKIPRINRVQTSSRIPTTRLQGQVQDNASYIQNTSRAVAGVAEQAMQVQERIELKTIKEKATQSEKAVAAWEKMQESAAKHKIEKEGMDPREVYAEIEVRRAEHYHSIKEKNKTGNTRVDDAVDSNILSRMNDYTLESDMRMMARQRTYDFNMYQDGLKLRTDQMAKSANDVVRFSTGIRDIQNDVALYAFTSGSAKEVEKDSEGAVRFVDPEGKERYVKLTKTHQMQMAKSTSDGVYSGINNLISSGELEKAKAVKELYGSYLTSAQMTKLNNKLQVNQKQNKASEVFASIQGLEDNQQLTAINDIKDPELRDDVLSLKVSLDKKMKYLKQQKDEQQEETLVDYVLNNRSKFFDKTELMRDEQFKMLSANVDPKVVSKVMKQIDAPKTSSLKAQVEVRDLLLRDDIREMSNAKFSTYLRDLDETDRRDAFKQFDDLKKGKTEAYSQAYSNANKMLENSLYASGLVKRGKKRVVRDEDYPKLAQAKKDLINFLSQQGVTNKTPPDQINKYIDEYVKSAKVQQLFGESNSFSLFSPSTWGVFGSDDQQDTVSTRQAAPVGNLSNPLEGMTDPQVVKLQTQYKNTYGNVPKRDDPLFLKYVSEQR